METEGTSKIEKTSEDETLEGSVDLTPIERQKVMILYYYMTDRTEEAIRDMFLFDKLPKETKNFEVLKRVHPILYHRLYEEYLFNDADYVQRQVDHLKGIIDKIYDEYKDYTREELAEEAADAHRQIEHRRKLGLPDY